jgi:hypothetical protein
VLVILSLRKEENMKLSTMLIMLFVTVAICLFVRFYPRSQHVKPVVVFQKDGTYKQYSTLKAAVEDNQTGATITIRGAVKE